jgi:hypothetical protein
LLSLLIDPHGLTGSLKPPGLALPMGSPIIIVNGHDFEMQSKTLSSQKQKALLHKWLAAASMLRRFESRVNLAYNS